MVPALNLAPIMDALPPSCRQRLYIMGWPTHTAALREPDRSLRRAIGAPQQVSLVDLELDPERWHGCYIATYGTVGWSRETICLGRIWLNPALALVAQKCSASAFPPVFQARITGVLLADSQVRATHRAQHHSPGGYGHFGLFIAEFLAASIHLEPSSSSARFRVE